MSPSKSLVDGNRYSFRNLVFSGYLELWTLEEVHKHSNSECQLLFSDCNQMFMNIKIYKCPDSLEFSGTENRDDEANRHMFANSLCEGVKYYQLVGLSAILENGLILLNNKLVRKFLTYNFMHSMCNIV